MQTEVEATVVNRIGTGKVSRLDLREELDDGVTSKVAGDDRPCLHTLLFEVAYELVARERCLAIDDDGQCKPRALGLIVDLHRTQQVADRIDETPERVDVGQSLLLEPEQALELDQPERGLQLGRPD